MRSQGARVKGDHDQINSSFVIAGRLLHCLVLKYEMLRYNSHATQHQKVAVIKRKEAEQSMGAY